MTVPAKDYPVGNPCAGTIRFNQCAAGPQPDQQSTNEAVPWNHDIALFEAFECKCFNFSGHVNIDAGDCLVDLGLDLFLYFLTFILGQFFARFPKFLTDLSHGDLGFFA